MTDTAILFLLVAWGFTLACLIVTNERQWTRQDKFLQWHEKSTQRLLDRIMAGDYVKLKQADTYEAVSKIQAQGIVDQPPEADESRYVGQTYERG